MPDCGVDGWFGVSDYDRHIQPLKDQTAVDMVVTLARAVSDLVDLVATGYECLTESCNVESIALAFVPILPASLGRTADDIVDVTMIERKMESVGNKLPNHGWGNANTLADHFSRHGRTLEQRPLMSMLLWRAISSTIVNEVVCSPKLTRMA